MAVIFVIFSLVIAKYNQCDGHSESNDSPTENDDYAQGGERPIYEGNKNRPINNSAVFLKENLLGTSVIGTKFFK